VPEANFGGLDEMWVFIMGIWQEGFGIREFGNEMVKIPDQIKLEIGLFSTSKWGMFVERKKLHVHDNSSAPTSALQNQ
jgi:hypothetical protein